MAARKNRNKTRRPQPQPRPKPAKPAAQAGIKPPPGGLQALFALPGRGGAAPPALAAVALCLLVAVSYLPATWAGLVWDDHAWEKSPQVLSPSGIWQIWFKPHTLQYEGHYWPLLYTTLWLEHKLWGLAPAGYHIVNLLLHSAVTLLLWRLLVRLAVPGAWLAAAVFAVHPLHVESVAWVIGRKDVLAGLFSMVCVLCYLRFVEERRRGFYFGALAALVAGLLCKSILITLPVSLLIWHWWKRGRITPADLRRVVPFLLTALAITLADWWQYRTREVITLEDYSFIEQALNAAHALWFYVGKLVWPAQLAVIYPRWSVSLGDPLAWGYLIAAGAALLLWRYRDRLGRGPLAGVLFFVVTLSPTLGFVEYGFMQFSLVADRYQYLAGAGITTAMVAAAARLSGTLPPVPVRCMQVAAALLLAVLGTLTWQQAGIYRDNLTFYSHIIAHNPQARNAYYNLGREHMEAGRPAEALAAFRSAGQVRPDHTWAYIGAGRAARDLERLAEAEKHFQRVLDIDPRFPAALDNLGVLRLRQKRYSEALELFQTLLEAQPEYAGAHVGTGVALASLNRLTEALRSFDRALELNPSLHEARTNRQRVLQDLQNRSGQ